MPIAEVNAVNHIRKARRVAQRVAERVRKGDLRRDEVDLAELLFGKWSMDDKLEKVGFLDKDVGLDELAELYAASFDWLLQRSGAGKVEEIAAKLRAKLAEARQPGKREPIFPGKVRAERSERDDRIIARDDAVAARLAAVHLNQRALYKGLSLAILDFVTRQVDGTVDEQFAHGTLQMGPAREAVADLVIEKVRKR